MSYLCGMITPNQHRLLAIWTMRHSISTEKLLEIAKENPDYFTIKPEEGKYKIEIIPEAFDVI